MAPLHIPSVNAPLNVVPSRIFLPGTCSKVSSMHVTNGQTSRDNPGILDRHPCLQSREGTAGDFFFRFRRSYSIGYEPVSLVEIYTEEQARRKSTCILPLASLSTVPEQNEPGWQVWSRKSARPKRRPLGICRLGSGVAGSCLSRSESQLASLVEQGCG